MPLGKMKKLWTLYQSLGKDALALLVSMYDDFEGEFPITQSWLTGNKPFRKMPKLAQLAALKGIIELHQEKQRHDETVDARGIF